MIDTRSLNADLKAITSLDDLWEYVDEFNAAIGPATEFRAVMGGGLSTDPALACVFINPTKRNISTWPRWEGPRYPFIGTKSIWRILNLAGLFPTDVCETIMGDKKWDEGFASAIYGLVAARGLYLTNLVKWTASSGDLPPKHLIGLYRQILLRELEIVRPSAILTFGCLPYKVLTGQPIRLSSILAEARSAGEIPRNSDNQLSRPIYPCYFPVGRGNPAGAVEILAMVAKQLGI